MNVFVNSCDDDVDHSDHSTHHDDMDHFRFLIRSEIGDFHAKVSLEANSRMTTDIIR